MQGSAPVLIGLGANEGDPAAQLAEAVAALARVLVVERISSVYRTAPVGFADQPDFLNLVVAGSTRRSPAGVLGRLQVIERRMGRVRTFRNGPRPIDLDLLSHGDTVMDTPRLVLPHPGIATRGFVLHPLAEVAPGWRHPVTGLTAPEMLACAGGLERVERLGPPQGAPGAELLASMRVLR
ncbi:MAG TPA: 2-amino-4-hydroxy-6-hydroxymethyldihydropteridine diphosphokinase [Longimicrobium sp.]|jgi:2-amino-4-hydroxy-6-hydroxymethyldihydropteridine diphosphokinase